MIKKVFTKIIPMVLVVLGVSGLYMFQVQADSKITVTADKTTALVSITISDTSLEGKEISVFCYSPQWDGSFSDWNKNEKYIVYLNQYRVSGTTKFNFQVNEKPVTGEYSLVIGSENSRVVKKFRFFPVESTKNPTEVKKLSTPKSIKAVQAGATTVKLAWGKVESAKSYHIYRSKKASSGFIKIGSTSGTSYKDKKAGAGKYWYYKVSAMGSKPAENSNQSSVVKVLVLKAPSINVKLIANGSVSIKWKKVKGAKGYIISVATKKSGKYKDKLTLKGASKTKGFVKKLKLGKTCYVKVRAYTTVNRKKVLGKYSKIKAVKIRRVVA